MSQKDPVEIEGLKKAIQPLRDVIKKKGQSQDDLATFFGVSREVVNRWLNGQTSPPKERRQAFIQLLRSLSLDHQEFLEIWQKVMVEVWDWESLPLELALNIPSRQQHLKVIGRDTLLTHLKQRLSAHESFALTGMPGVGKTALAMELVHDDEVLKQFADGVFWIRLGENPNVMDELGRLAERLKVVNVPKLTTEVERYLAVKNIIDEGRRHFLIVIDDAWDVEPARFFNFAGSNCCLILTTRNEKVARGFFADPNKVVIVPELEYEHHKNPAFELLSKLAPEACAADPRATEELVKTVGGLPLALVLLGGYLGDPDRVHVSDEEKRDFLQIIKDDPQTRLHLAQARLGALNNNEMTLQAIIELSLEDLQRHKEEKAVQVFYALGAFASKPERFDRSAARYVTREDDSLSLSKLIVRYLLEEYEQEQVAIHQVLADVARTKTPAEAVVRHREFYLTLVKEAKDDWQQIERVYGQIKWAWASVSPDESLFEFIDALQMYQNRRGLWHELIDWNERGLQLAERRGSQREIGTLLMNLGNAYESQGRWSDAIAKLEESLRIFRKLGDWQSESYVLGNLAIIRKNQGNLEEARRLYTRSLRIAQALGDRNGESKAFIGLGNIYLIQRRWKEATKQYEKSLLIKRELGDRMGESLVLNNLANIYTEQGNWEEAIQRCEKALYIVQEFGDRDGEAAILNSLGIIYQKQERLPEAMMRFEESLSISRELDARHNEGMSLLGLGNVFGLEQKWPEAIVKYEESLHIFRQTGDSYHEVLTLSNLGITHTLFGDYPLGLNSFKEGLLLARKTGLTQLEAYVLSTIRGIYSDFDDNQRAQFTQETQGWLSMKSLNAVDPQRASKASLTRAARVLLYLGTLILSGISYAMFPIATIISFILVIIWVVTRPIRPLLFPVEILPQPLRLLYRLIQRCENLFQGLPKNTKIEYSDQTCAILGLLLIFFSVIAWFILRYVVNYALTLLYLSLSR